VQVKNKVLNLISSYSPYPPFCQNIKNVDTTTNNNSATQKGRLETI
jgi:hypothetical protein